MSIPLIFALHDILFNEQSARQFLFNTGVFYTSMACPDCGGPMKLYLEDEKYRCGKRTCRKARSLRHGTFFSRSRLPCNKILYFGYLWLLKTSSDSMITQL